MAPERFDGWSDPRSDVYGLGMTLYELLTLRPAYEAATRARLIDEVLHDPRRRPVRSIRRIPRDLETIVLKAIAKEPAERYPTAWAMANDLENFLAGKPIKARRVGPFETAWRWCRRNPAAAGLDGQRRRDAHARRAGRGPRIPVTPSDGLRREGRGPGPELTFLYLNRIQFAQGELDENNPDEAESLLDECPQDRATGNGITSKANVTRSC